MTLIHRFTSPAWLDVLKRHLAGAIDESRTLFDTIIGLRCGEAVLFCPTAQIEVYRSKERCKQLKALGSGFVKVKIRKRITIDGGKSVMATNALDCATNPSVEGENIRMHILTPVQAKREIALRANTGTTSTSSSTCTNKIAEIMPPLTAQSSQKTDSRIVAAAQIPPDSTHSTSSSGKSSTMKLSGKQHNAAETISTRAQLQVAAKRYIDVSVKQGNWPPLLTLNKIQKNELYSQFKNSLIISPNTVTKKDCRNALFNQLGQSIVSIQPSSIIPSHIEPI